MKSFNLELFTLKGTFRKSLVEGWIEQLKSLPTITESEQQTAYTTFVGGFKGKFIYSMRTISELWELLRPLENIIRYKFIQSITGGTFALTMNASCYHSRQDMEVLLFILLFHEIASFEYENSKNFNKIFVPVN